MKTTTFFFLAAATTALAIQSATADVLADWTFESSAPAGTPGAGVWFTNIAAEIGSGTASGLHAGNAAYSTPAGDGSTHAFSSALWAVGDFYQFSVGTLNFNNITLSFEQVSSGTGPASFGLQYSLDGNAFSSFAIYTVTNSPSWSPTTGPFASSSFSFDLSSVTALNNDSSVYFRLVDLNNAVDAAGTAAVGTAGTDRVDDFVVNGIAVVPEPSTLALSALGGLAGFFALRRRR